MIFRAERHPSGFSLDSQAKRIMAMARIARGLISALLLISVVIGPTLLSFFGKESTALLPLVCLLIVLLSLNVNVDQLEQIGLGPLSAKLRAKIAQADELNERLKKAIRQQNLWVVSGSGNLPRA
jgi:hypothetical protein